MSGETPACDDVIKALEDIKRIDNLKPELSNAFSRLLAAPGDLSGDAASAFFNCDGGAGEIPMLASDAFKRKLDALTSVTNTRTVVGEKLDAATMKLAQLRQECDTQRAAQALKPDLSKKCIVPRP